MKFQRVADLNVTCSLKVRNFDKPSLAMSDCCGAPAKFAVEMVNKNKMWRCGQHQNIRSLETGPSMTYIEVLPEP